MWLKFLIFSVVLQQCCSVIYKLNVTEYNRMPALYHLDAYDDCLAESGGLYCLVDAALYTTTPSDLMHMIQAYSNHTMKHYNHTQIHRGVCVTQTCKQFIKQENGTMDLDKTLAACLNHSVWKYYKLQASLLDVQYCYSVDKKIDIDIYDILVSVVFVVIILLNAIGSLYDICICKDDPKAGNGYLLAFSLRRNWQRLVAPSGIGPEPRLERLKCFHGLRTITMLCVIFSHAVLIMSFSYVDNPLYIENSYEDLMKQLLFNGSLVTHTFFVMSAFLLAYNYQLQLERRPASWWLLPRGILLRWLRLTPAYAVTLGFICSLGRHLGDGPLWGQVVGSEAAACRRYWWAHLLYINNYVYDDALCAPQTWYLAADTQLFALGLALCACGGGRRLLAGALLAGLLVVAAHTYWQELTAIVIQSPETYRELYSQDDTFRLLYIRGHTNLSTYVLGLAGGFLTYNWQTKGNNLHSYKKWVWLYWLLFPLGVLVILSGGLFYTDEPITSRVMQILYATLYKPVFQLIVVGVIMGAIFKIENWYRCVVEWRGWAWAGRASYCAFLVHTLVQRGLVGAQRRPTHLSDYYVLLIVTGTFFLSYTLGAVLWMLVEAPVAALVKHVTSPPKKSVNNTQNTPL